MDNKFKIICPSYNNAEWIKYCLVSIINQTYKNFDVLFIDDCSTDNSYEIASNIVEGYENIKIVANKERMRRGYNIFVPAFDFVDDNEDIIAFVDGDDWLFDDYVLEKVNEEYNKHDYWMTYGQFVVWPEGTIARGGQGSEYPQEVKKGNLYRKDIWRASHLRTFKWFLYKNIIKEELTYSKDGKIYKMCEDLATSFPCLEKCPSKKIGCLDFFTYVYNKSDSNKEKIDKQYDVDGENEEWHSIGIEIRNKEIHKKKTKDELVS